MRRDERRNFPGAMIWAIGPTVTLPTATDTLLGAGK